MKPKAEPPFYAPSRWEGLLAAIPGALVYAVSIYLRHGGIGTIGAAFLTGLIVSVWICAPLWRQGWFWISMLLILGMHVVVLVAFDWSDAVRWTGLTFIPFAVADVVGILVVVYLIFRLINGPPTRLVRLEDDQC